MSIVQAIVLGIVQGLTEFLPVSSSGHLVLAQSFFGLHEPALLFDSALHCGTLAAVLLVFRRDIAALARELWMALRTPSVACVRQRYATHEQGRMLVLIIVGTIPTVLIGLAFKDLFARMFASVQIVGLTLMVTGGLLLLTRYCSANRLGCMQLRLWHAVLIGVAQGLAITPGISRSGATIALALFLGVQRETAGRFSFLLCIPAIVGATVLNLSDGGAGASLPALAAGTIAAALTGWLALRLLLQLVKQGRFYLFAPYCLLVGAGALIYVG